MFLGEVAGAAYLRTLLFDLEAHPAHKLLLASNISLGPLHGLALSNLLLSCMLHRDTHVFYSAHLAAASSAFLIAVLKANCL